MKKISRILALVLVLASLFSVTALAAEVVLAENANAKIIQADPNVTAQFDPKLPGKFTLTYTGPGMKEGGFYNVMVIKSADGVNYEISEKNILYIFQETAVMKDGKLSLTFAPYPSSLENSVVLITGLETGTVKAATIESKYTLGDVNLSNSIDAGDAIWILRVSANIDTFDKQPELQKQLADVNKNNSVDSGDGIWILRAVAGLEKIPG